MPGLDGIRSNGWRQGSLFREDDHCTLQKHINRDIPSRGRCVVVSHDCDIVHNSYENEPTVDILLATRVDRKPDSRLTYGKNPRALQLPIFCAANKIYYHFRAADRHLLDRSTLESLSPDIDCYLAQQELRILVNWLANRYTRVAFPDAFNKRISMVKGKIQKVLHELSDDLTAIYIDISPWTEVNNDDSYKVMVYATMSPVTYQDTTRRQTGWQAINSIATLLEECDGIEVIDHALKSEEDISIDDARQLKTWDFDWLSLRDDEDSALPVDI